MKKYCIDPKFPLGYIMLTGRAVEAMKGKDGVLDWLLSRHQAGDWGHVGDDQKLENDAALSGWELKSAYRYDDGTEYVVVTDANRKFTTVSSDTTQASACQKGFKVCDRFFWNW